ncbi:MAG: hypothetical protein JNK12_21275 [Acidimicrobiales bacterium]|nr:hypothetical protein [Acidimicrobiales bacterium]
MSFTPDELERFARTHLEYEVCIAAHTAAMWQNGPGILDRAAQSAFMISSLVHLRLLDDFFGMKKRPVIAGREMRDVMALDYVSHWTPVRPLGDRRDAVNVQVAHLSMDRLEGLPWNVLRLTVDVLEVFGTFVGQLTPLMAEALEGAEVVAEAFVNWSARFDLDHPEDLGDLGEPYTFLGTPSTTTNGDPITTWPFDPSPIRGS